MKSTLEEALGPVLPYLPEELIAANGLADIAAVAREMPGGLTSYVDFECRLGRPERRADFLVRTREDGGEREHLAGTAPEGGLPDHLLQHPAWSRVRDFAIHWSSPASALHRQIDRVWLEFDLDRSPSAIPVPGVFFFGQGTDRAGWSPGHATSVTGRADWWMTDAAIPLIRGAHLPDAIERHLIHCIASLPAGATVYSLGVMLARDLDDVRLAITDLTRQGILEYLDRIGWPGALRDVADLLARWPGLVGRVDLDIDVAETVGPRIGLEFHGPERGLRTPSGQTPAWLPFVDELVRDGLCRADKRDGLRAYGGVSDELRDRARWPERLLHASTLLGPDWVSINHRRVEYIKIVHASGKPPEAKAYLGAAYDWFSRTRPTRVKPAGSPRNPAGYSQRSTEGMAPRLESG